jgi:hypothetical protein
MSTVSSTSAGAGGDHVHLDAGLLGEGVEQRLDELAFAIGIDVDLAALGENAFGSRDDRAGRNGAARERAQASSGHANSSLQQMP